MMGYEKTLAGWLRALTTGMPGYPPTWEFFRGTLLSGGLFSGLFVGAMKLVGSRGGSSGPGGGREPRQETEEAEPSLAPAADDTGDRPAS